MRAIVFCIQYISYNGCTPRYTCRWVLQFPEAMVALSLTWCQAFDKGTEGLQPWAFGRASKRLVPIPETEISSVLQTGRKSCLSQNEILLSITPKGSCPSSTKGTGNLRWGMMRMEVSVISPRHSSMLLGFCLAWDSLLNIALPSSSLRIWAE